jgi:hypothetical protein
LKQWSLKLLRRKAPDFEFEVSAPQFPTHYSPAGIDDVVNQNIRRSDVIFSDILDSNYTPIVFHILDHFKI